MVKYCFDTGVSEDRMPKDYRFFRIRDENGKPVRCRGQERKALRDNFVRGSHIDADAMTGVIQVDGSFLTRTRVYGFSDGIFVVYWDFRREI